MKLFSNTFFKYFTCGSIGCEITSNYSFYISTYSLLTYFYIWDHISKKRCQRWIVWQNIYLLLCYKHWLITLDVKKLNVVTIENITCSVHHNYKLCITTFFVFLADFPQNVYNPKESKSTLAIIPYQVQFNATIRTGVGLGKYIPTK